MATLQLAQHVQINEESGVCVDGDKQLACGLEALAIYRGDPTRRTLIEASLLSGESDAAIGKRLGLEPAVVCHYEMMFFSVRDRLNAGDWVILVAVNWPIDPELNRDVASVIKLMAYRGGPVVLDVVLVATGMHTALNLDHQLDSVDEPLATKVRLLVDLLCHPPKGQMALRLWELLREIKVKQPPTARTSWHQMQVELDYVVDDVWATPTRPLVHPRKGLRESRSKQQTATA